jgi:hypothetical protein
VASKVAIETQWGFFQLANSAAAMFGDRRKAGVAGLTATVLKYRRNDVSWERAADA